MEEALNQKLSKIKYMIFYKITGVFIYSSILISIATSFITEYQDTNSRLENKTLRLNELSYKNQVLSNNQSELEELEENFRQKLMSNRSYNEFRAELEQNFREIIDKINQKYELPRPITLDSAVPVLNNKVYKNAPSEVKSLKVKLSYAASDTGNFIDIAEDIYNNVKEELEITGLYMDKAEVLNAGNIDNILDGKDPILIEGQLTFYNRELILDKK
jgi:predicted RNase H-like nuclease (RuvC/YqgF family)